VQDHALASQKKRRIRQDPHQVLHAESRPEEQHEKKREPDDTDQSFRLDDSAERAPRLYDP
jgi:hypothetical protein